MKKPCRVQARWAGPVSIAFAIAFLFGIAVGSAQAQAIQPDTTPRTVLWYAENPQERARVELTCLDDPGRLMGSADCTNAHQASVEIAVRAGRSRTGTTDPRDPVFWSDDPENRKAKLLMCSRNPELLYCDVARRSLIIEAGKARR
ncbi:EexN family lipoprotein [Agrobacterium rosae]|uniref:Uncharacterized protein n=1 Tax=Agrobacterium rosae TaxID=1972867 RepID=A0A1R3U2Z7_9HYPH|nr:EexN family lipoprotein [Agrobacterium rosae]SCX35830.1 hypothetical protein DSM25559_5173 [Agrobacterium rosae]